MLRFLKFAGLILVISMMGCKGSTGPQGPTGPMGPTGPGGSRGPQGAQGVSALSIVGQVYSDSNQTISKIWVSGGSSIPSVSLNQYSIPLSITLGTYGGFDGLPFYYYGGYRIAPLDTAALKIVTPTQNAYGRVRMPGGFAIISPSPAGGFALSPRQAFHAAWAHSDSSAYYWINFSYNYNYLDSEGAAHGLGVNFDTLVETDSVVIRASLIFPSNFASYQDFTGSSYGSLNVIAVSGPTLQSGAVGNIGGNGTGFLIGTYDAGSAPFTSSSALPLAGRKLTEEPKESKMSRLMKRFVDESGKPHGAKFQ